MTIEALIALDDQTLLKVGPDLANFCALALEKHTDCSGLLQAILNRVGSLDNDLVVFALLNKEELLPKTPKLLKELIFDLVKYYFKPQSASV